MQFHSLEIAKGLFLELTRIGYKDEGIRLIVGDTIPYKMHFEVQLSRKDAEWLVKQLGDALKDKRQDNLR